MTLYWEPGTQYNEGDVVEYEGHRYKIIQPHRSQSDWTPPQTPALWGKLQDGDRGDHQQQNINDKPPQQSEDSQPERNLVDKAKDFYHEHEKEAKITGGIAAGAALLGAAGLAYKHHQGQQQHGEKSDHQNNEGGHGFLDQAGDFVHDHGKELGIGAGVLAAGAVGFAAYQHSHNKKNDD